ncbi:hypothetical protein ACWEWG_25895 [Streptomyces sp. NPDC003758]
MIAYLSGIRDAEVRELAPDCAFTENGPDGRIRHKLRGRVLTGRKLTGEEANGSCSTSSTMPSRCPPPSTTTRPTCSATRT